MNKVAVVGLGYVGLPLALLADEKGFDVIGIELDKAKVDKLAKRQTDIDDGLAVKRLAKTNVKFTSTTSSISSRDIVIICVPTPVDEKKQPDLGPVKTAVSTAAKNMRPGSLLVVESTINPGVCDEIIIPLIEKESRHVVGTTIHLAHCPERINPGDPKWTVDNISRVVGADSDKGLELVYNFYTKLIDGSIKKMDNLKEAEAVKIVENTFRDINIAFVNELAMSFSNIGVNVVNVIDGASTKPFAFLPHYPGIGIGGHCIPVDPYYLIEYASNNGFEHKFLKLARSINESMPVYSVDLLEKTLIEKSKKTLKDAAVAVLGLSYKANVGDDRESPAYAVIKAMEARGAKVTTYDPYLFHKSSAKDVVSAIANKDAVVITTAHKEFVSLSAADFKGIPVLLDGRNIFRDIKSELENLGTKYIGVGV